MWSKQQFEELEPRVLLSSDPGFDLLPDQDAHLVEAIELVAAPDSQTDLSDLSLGAASLNALSQSLAPTELTDLVDLDDLGGAQEDLVGDGVSDEAEDQGLEADQGAQDRLTQDTLVSAVDQSLESPVMESMIETDDLAEADPSETNSNASFVDPAAGFLSEHLFSEGLSAEALSQEDLYIRPPFRPLGASDYSSQGDYNLNYSLGGFYSADWSTTGNASVDSNYRDSSRSFLKLTGSGQGENGAAWNNKTLVSAGNDWVATFVGEVDYLRGNGADGMGFYLQNGGTSNLLSGNDPAPLNYGSFLGVFVDTYEGDGRGNCIEILYRNGTNGETRIIGTMNLGGPLEDRTTFQVSVTYDASGNSLRVYFQEQGGPDFSSTAWDTRADQTFSLNNSGLYPSTLKDWGEAWWGFVGKTGGDAEDHWITAASMVSSAPTVTLTAPSGTQTGPFSVTLGLSDYAGSSFSSAGFSVSNGSVSNPTYSYWSGSQYIYTAAVTPNGDGWVNLSIPAKTFQDQNGNWNLASNSVSAWAGIPPSGHSITLGSSVINASQVSSSSFTFAGAEVNATYRLDVTSSGGGTTVTRTGTVTASNQQITGIDVTGLEDGTLTYAVVLTDPAGNAASAKTATATKDATAPTLSSISLPSSTLYGSEVGAIDLSLNDAEVGTTYHLFIADSAGTELEFSGTVPSNRLVRNWNVAGLVDGQLTFDVTLTDAAGNNSAMRSTTATLTSGPSIASIALSHAAINASQTGSVSLTLNGVDATAGTQYHLTIRDTNSDTLLLSGSIPDDDTIGGIDVSSLADGDLTFEVKLTDSGGTDSNLVTATATMDTVAPTLDGLSLSTTAINAAQASAYSLSLVGVEVGATYHLIITDGVTTVSPSSGTVQAGGAISGIDLSSLVDGAITFSVVLNDGAGNQSGASTATATKDTVAPTAPSLSLASAGGPFSQIPDTLLTQTKVLLGNAEVGATYSARVSSTGGGTQVSKTGTITSGAQEISGIDVSGLGDGTLTYRVTLTDAAGNPSTEVSSTAIKGANVGFDLEGTNYMGGYLSIHPDFLNDGQLNRNPTYQWEYSTDGISWSANGNSQTNGSPFINQHWSYRLKINYQTRSSIAQAWTNAEVISQSYQGRYNYNYVNDILNASSQPVVAGGFLGGNAAEGVASAVDGNSESKYLNAGAQGNTVPTGLTVVSAKGAVVVDRIYFTSANDATERDPNTFKLYGSNTSSGGWELITSGNTTLPGTPGQPDGGTRGVQVYVDFAKTKPYLNYWIEFTSLKGVSDLMQIAEVDLGGYAETSLSGGSFTIDGYWSVSNPILTDYAVLSGSASVYLGSYVPTVGERFQLVAGLNLRGSFSSITKPALPAGLAWQEVYDTHSVELVVVKADNVAPTLTGVSVNGGSSWINAAQDGNLSLTLEGAEIGTTYLLTVTDQDGASLSYSDTVPDNRTLSGLDVSSLSDGLLTFAITLYDSVWNQSPTQTTTPTKDTMAPTSPTLLLGSVMANNKVNVSQLETTKLTLSGAEVYLSNPVKYSLVVNSSGGEATVTASGDVISSTQELTGIDVSGLVDGTLTYTVTLTDAAGNDSTSAVATATLDTSDMVAPSGHSLLLGSLVGDTSVMDASTTQATALTLYDAEIGATYDLVVTSAGGGNAVTATGSIISSTQEITGIDVSTLGDGTLTYSVVLTDTAGNASQAVSATATKDTEAPANHALALGSLVSDSTMLDVTKLASSSLTLTGAEVDTVNPITFTVVVTSAGGGNAVC